MSIMRDVFDIGIKALARHYGETEAQTADQIADMAEEFPDRGGDPLLSLVKSLVIALEGLHDFGFDYAAVVAAEEAEAAEADGAGP